MKLLDGLVNLVSGLGTARDKASGAGYTHQPLTIGELLTAYDGSSMVRRAVDLPAEDAVREWREWQAEGADISKIEAEEARLGLQGKVFEARRLARLLGSAALLIGDGAPDPSQPLDPARIGTGGLKYVTLLEQDDFTPGQLGTDPFLPGFRKPSYWTVGGTRQQIHPSRLALFYGVAPLSSLHDLSHAGRGKSVLNGMLEAIQRVDEGAGNVLSLVYEAKVDVFGVPRLMENLRTRGDAYAEEVLRRTRLAATAKGINGMLLRDSEETYEQKSATFGSLPDVLDRFMQLASAASGIPMTLLFGISPGGLNATGESDIRAYYDRVRVQQSLHMTPAMHVLDECLIRSALGDRPADLHYNWRPLWQESAKEKAENADKLMSAAERLDKLGSVPREALAQSAVNALTESGAFPGLEAAVGEFYQPGEADPAEEGMTE